MIAPLGLPEHLTDTACPVRRLPDGALSFSSPAAVEQILSDPRLTMEHELAFGCPEDAFRDHSANMAAPFSAGSGKRHRDLRHLMHRPFTRRAIGARTPRIIEIAHRYAAALPDHARADGAVDLVEHYCRRLPYLVTAEILGLGDDTERLYGPIWRWVGESSAAESVTEVDTEREAWETWQELIDERRGTFRARERERAGAQPGLLDVLIAAQMAGVVVGDRGMTDEDIIGTVTGLFSAGMTTVASGLALLIAHLDASGQWGEAAMLEQLNHPVASALAYQIMVADAPFPSVYRVAREDILDMPGHPIRQHDVVTGNIIAAQRARAQDAQEVDEAAAWHSLLMWGRKDHRCPGEYAAQVQLVEGLRTMLLRYPGLRVIERGERPWPAIVPSFPSMLVLPR